MGHLTLFILIIGLPLLLVAAAFFVLVNKAFGGKNGQAEAAQTLETARQLERTLSAMEQRLGALEDIIMASGEKKSGPDPGASGGEK